MKNNQLILIFIALFTGVKAQDIQYSYNANGARVLRQVIVMMQLPEDSITELETNREDLFLEDVVAQNSTNDFSTSEEIESNNEEARQRESETNTKNSENFAETLEGTEITVYPNPTAGELKVAFSDLSNMNQGTIIFYDNAGKQISTQKINSNLEFLDISKEAKGNYIMLINIINIAEV